MEQIQSSLRSTGANIFDMRLSRPPTVTGGRSFQDFGSGLGQPKNSHSFKQSRPRENSGADTRHSTPSTFSHIDLMQEEEDDSPDELDMLSSDAPDPGSSMQPVVPAISHDHDPEVISQKSINLRKLKIKKNKDISSSNIATVDLTSELPLKENDPKGSFNTRATSRAAVVSKGSSRHKVENTSTSRGRKKPATSSCTDTCDGSRTPTPRPSRTRSSSRIKAKKRESFPMTPPRKSPDSAGGPSKLAAPRDFPLKDMSPSSNVSPKSLRRTASFPVLSPVSSTSRTNAPFPAISPLSSQERPPESSFPSPSPLSVNSPRSKKGKDSKGVGKASHSFGGKDEHPKFDPDSRVRNKMRPFPMSSQDLESIGDSPHKNVPSRLGKRSPDDRKYNERDDTKKRKEDDRYRLSSSPDGDIYDEEDSYMLASNHDPKTLCPYCDTPLPSSPTPTLLKLLAKTRKKSTSDPRPTNPLGLKAPLTTFVTVCQRHRFESQIFPEAERQGWPKVINWDKLGRRIEKMRRELMALIKDTSHCSEPGLGNRHGEGPRSRCVFWQEVMKEVKAKGVRAATGIRGQFENFEKTQPGYYGEQGSVIIYHTLYNLFPPEALDASLIAPLSANQFIQRVLVPEVGVRLIMEDRKLSGDAGREAAERVLRESAAYGTAMFPEDEGNKGKDRDDDELGVADKIVMERARKRRKELEEEEREEMERLEREKVEAESGVQVSVFTSTPERPRRRLRPRPIPRDPACPDPASDSNTRHCTVNSRGKQVTNIEAENFRSVHPAPVTTSIESDAPAPSNGVRRSKRRKKQREDKVDLDLCLSSDDTGLSDASVGSRMQRSKSTGRSASSRSSTTYIDSCEDNDVERDGTPDSAQLFGQLFDSKTPLAGSSHHVDISTTKRRDDDDGETPRPARVDSQPEPDDFSALSSQTRTSFVPLQEARRRRQPATGDGTWSYSLTDPVDSSSESSREPSLKSFNLQQGYSKDYDWLLSDGPES